MLPAGKLLGNLGALSSRKVMFRPLELTLFSWFWSDSLRMFKVLRLFDVRFECRMWPTESWIFWIFYVNLSGCSFYVYITFFWCVRPKYALLMILSLSSADWLMVWYCTICVWERVLTALDSFKLSYFKPWPFLEPFAKIWSFRFIFAALRSFVSIMS